MPPPISIDKNPVMYNKHNFSSRLYYYPPYFPSFFAPVIDRALNMHSLPEVSLFNYLPASLIVMNGWVRVSNWKQICMLAFLARFPNIHIIIKKGIRLL